MDSSGKVCGHIHKLSPSGSDSRPASFRIRMLVSSLCITLPCAACRISSFSTGRSKPAARFTSSHCVLAGNGIPSCFSRCSGRLKGHACAVLNQCCHRHGTGIELFRAGRLWLTRPEDLTTGIASQPFHLKYCCLQRWPSHDPHQRLQFFLAIHFSFAAFRAVIARLELRVLHAHLLRTGIVKCRSVFKPHQPEAFNDIRAISEAFYGSPAPGRILHCYRFGACHFVFTASDRRLLSREERNAREG